MSNPFGRVTRKVKQEVYGEPKIEGKRSCPICECWFFSEEDLKAHVEIHWKRAKNSDGDWMPCMGDPYLTTRIKMNGSFSLNGYKYSLIDNKVLYRTRIRLE